MSPYHLLLIDDERDAVDALAAVLRREGFDVSVAYTGEDGLQQARTQRPDVLVLDILLPGIDGRAVCRALRAAGDHTPIIMLTAIRATGEKIHSLEEGADDYLDKPFDPYELIARIRAVLRRGRPSALEQAPAWRCRARGLRLERRPGSRGAYLQNRLVALTPKALDLLEYLMAHAGEDVSYETLLRAVWHSTLNDRDTVKVRVGELRRKLGDDSERPVFIETVSGIGYRFIGPVEAEP